MDGFSSQQPQSETANHDAVTLGFSHLASAKSPVGIYWALFGLCVLISIAGPIGLITVAGCAFGATSFWLWQQRLTVRRIMKLGSTASFFTRVYLPVIWSCGWQSVIVVALIPATLAYLIAPDFKAPTAMAAPIFFWMVSYSISLLSPVATLRKAAMTTYFHATAQEAVSERTGSLARPVPVWMEPASLIATLAALSFMMFSVLLDVKESSENGHPAMLFGAFVATIVMLGAAVVIPAAAVAGAFNLLGYPFVKVFKPAYALALFLASALLFSSSGITRIEGALIDAEGRQKNASLLNAVGQFEDVLDTAQSTLDSSRQSESEIEKAGNLLKHAASEQLKLSQEYEEALAKDGLEDLLDPDRVHNDKDFSQSMEIANKILNQIKHFEAKEQQLVFEDLPNHLKTLGLSASSEREALESYMKGLEKSLPQMKENWRLERHVLDQFVAIIAHLKATRDRWEPQDGYFMFEREADLERFNELMARVDDAVAKQEELRRASLANARAQLEQLKETVRD